MYNRLLEQMEYYLKDSKILVDPFIEEWEKETPRNKSFFSRYFEPEETAFLDFQSVSTKEHGNLIATNVAIGSHGGTIPVDTIYKMSGELGKFALEQTMTERDYMQIQSALLLSDPTKEIVQKLVDPIEKMKKAHLNTLDFLSGQVISNGYIIFSSNNTYGRQEKIDYFSALVTNSLIDATSVATLRADKSGTAKFSASTTDIFPTLFDAMETFETETLYKESPTELFISYDVALKLLQNNGLSQFFSGVNYGAISAQTITSSQTNFLPYSPLEENLTRIIQSKIPQIQRVHIIRKKYAYMTSAGVVTTADCFAGKKIVLARKEKLGKMLWKLPATAEMRSSHGIVNTGLYGGTISIYNEQIAPPSWRYAFESFNFPRFDEIGNTLIWQVMA